MFATHASRTSPESTEPTHTDRSGDDGARPPIDYRPLREAARLAISWLLDVARSGASDHEDRDAIDRVERAALASVAGVPMCCRPAELRASEEDVLVTAGILIERAEIDFRMPGLSQIFGAIYESLDWSQRSAPARTDGANSGRGASNHAMHRHSVAASIARTLGALLAPRAPRVAHGAGERAGARILVFPLR